MNVEVPDGVMPGDPMSIMVGDQEFTITVPDGVGPGMLIEVDLPIAEEAPPGPSDEPLTEAVLVDVPPGMGPGDVFNVETAWGGVFEIAVPDGVGPGEQIQVELPTQAAHEGGGAPLPPPPPPPATTPWELVGRRAALCGLIAKAILNGRKGTVRSYNPEKDRLVVTIDGMHPGERQRRHGARAAHTRTRALARRATSHSRQTSRVHLLPRSPTCHKPRPSLKLAQG